MKNFKTYQLALTFYKKCRLIRIHNRNIRDQFERTSLSVVLNIAEGQGRITTKDRRRFYVIAKGSLQETQCLLDLMGENDLIIESGLPEGLIA